MTASDQPEARASDFMSMSENSSQQLKNGDNGNGVVVYGTSFEVGQNYEIVSPIG